MAKLTNTTRMDITLPARHVIPGNGSIDVTNDIIRGDNWTVLQGMIINGMVTAEYDADPEPAPESKTGLRAKARE